MVYLIFASLQDGFEDHLKLSDERTCLQHGLLGAPHTCSGDQSHGLRDACRSAGIRLGMFIGDSRYVKGYTRKAVTSHVANVLKRILNKLGGCIDLVC